MDSLSEVETGEITTYDNIVARMVCQYLCRLHHHSHPLAGAVCRVLGFRDVLAHRRVKARSKSQVYKSDSAQIQADIFSHSEVVHMHNIIINVKREIERTNEITLLQG